MRSRRTGLRAVALLTVVASACSGGGDDDIVAAGSTSTTSASSSTAISAQVASYDLSVSRPQRVLVGLVAPKGQLVSYGTARFGFAFLGQGARSGEDVTIEMTAPAEWTPIPGQELPAGPQSPALVAPSEGTGVYAAQDVVFDRPGKWGVIVEVDVEGTKTTAQAQFEVREEPAVIDVADPAPRTENHLPGADGVPPDAVDSRASGDGSVPDAALHQVTVADALESGRPTLVVVSTPVYCVSQFCGPITDSVLSLAEENAERMNFIHLEVWRDYEATTLNKAAAEWIRPSGEGSAAEPWVFAIDASGTVVRRFDNVASDAELAATVAQLTT